MTIINSSRRAFLQGRVAGTTRRIPWAVAAFAEACSRCGACIEACGERILVVGDGGFPTIDFARGGCTFCGACATACRDGALDATRAPPWPLRVAIDAGCLSAQGISCRTCGDACDTHAIRFRLQPGGRAVPVVDTTRCTGCGSCIATCPIQVIQLKEAA